MTNKPQNNKAKLSVPKNITIGRADKVAKKLEKKIVSHKNNVDPKKIEKISDKVSKKIINNSNNIDTAKKVASGLVSIVLKDPMANVTSKTIISRIAHKIITRNGNNPANDNEVEYISETEQTEYNY